MARLALRAVGRAGERLYTAEGEAVVRLLTPLDVRYADAYALGYPFDKPVPALAESAGARRMIEETVELARKAMEAEARLNVIANNWAYGNVPARLETSPTNSSTPG